jgi:hypothetical protein
MLTGLSKPKKIAKLREMRMFLKRHGIKRVSNDPHKREMQYRRLLMTLDIELVQNEDGRLVEKWY